MTLLTDLNALSLTANAKSVGAKRGVDMVALVTLAIEQTLELTALLKVIVGIHPTTGGDAANHSSLTAIIAELA